MAISGIELFCDAKIEGDSCSSDSGKRQNDDCFTGRPFISLEKETLKLKHAGQNLGQSGKNCSIKTLIVIILIKCSLYGI